MAAGAVLLGCGDDESAPSPAGATNPTAYGGSSSIGPGAGGSTATGAGTGGAGLPPETEHESGFGLPVLSGSHVWSANPLSGRVAVIDTEDLAIELSKAGNSPEELAALPPQGSVLSAAVVLNQRSRDATVLRLTSAGIERATVPTHVGASDWSVSPSGHWAIAWTDASRLPSPDPAESYQDITLIETGAAAPEATRLSVGYRPSRIFFSEDERRAFVVCAPGISVVELDHSPPRILRDVELSDDPADLAIDVSIVPDGTHALSRIEGRPEVQVTDLETGERTTVVLSGPVTDLDLVSNGTQAIAVVRAPATAGISPETLAPPMPEPSEIAILSIADILDDPEVYESISIDALVGSVAVSEGGEQAVLYTTATDRDEVVLLPTDPDADAYLEPRTVALRAPVDAVFVAPDAGHALVVLKRTQSPGGAFAVVPLGEALPARIETTDAPVTGVAFAPAPTTRALVTARTGETAYLVRLPSLLVEPVALPSPPLAAGIVSDPGVAFVAEQHPEGRITLVDLETAEPRTVTGFELSARVIDEN